MCPPFFHTLSQYKKGRSTLRPYVYQYHRITNRQTISVSDQRER